MVYVLQPIDHKNIRRRVYDALNVLMAMNIISKEKKEIRWLGLPTNSAQECQHIEVCSCVYQKDFNDWACKAPVLCVFFLYLCYISEHLYSRFCVGTCASVCKILRDPRKNSQQTRQIIMLCCGSPLHYAVQTRIVKLYTHT